MGMFSGFGGGGGDSTRYHAAMQQWLKDQEDAGKLDQLNAIRSNYGPVIDEQMANTTDPQTLGSLKMIRAGLNSAAPDGLNAFLSQLTSQQSSYAHGGIPTDDMKEFGLAQRQGYGGSLQQWLGEQHRQNTPSATQMFEYYNTLPPDQRENYMRFAHAPTPGMLGANASSTEQGKTEGGQLAKDEIDLRNAHATEQEKLARYVQLDQLLGDSGGFQGKNITEIQKAASLLGFDIKGLDEKQAAVALENQLTLDSRNTATGGGMPGSMSDADRNFLSAMQPGINMTPAGRKQFIEVQKRLVTRRKEIADLASEYRKTNGTLNMGFYDELAKLREQRLFQDMESPAAPAATQAPAPAASPSGWRVLR